MASKPSQGVEEYPSLLWIACVYRLLRSAEDNQTFCSVPSVVLVSAYFINRWWKAYQLKNYGIGKGGASAQGVFY